MKIQKGIVKYKDRNDLSCTYGITDEGKTFYFLGEDALKNGNRIVSTALVEAIDPMVKASSVGLIDADGHEIIPCEYRSIKTINEDIILVEKAQPASQSVIDAINLKSVPAEATKLVSTSATIKGKLNAQMGPEGRYFFNDQFSEATVCDINGNNLVNDEYFSFIGMANGKLYFSKNTENSEITEYSILPPEVQSDVTPANDTNEIDVSDVEVSKDVVEDALNSEVFAESVSEEAIPTGTEDVSEIVEESALESDMVSDNHEEIVEDVQTSEESALTDDFDISEEVDDMVAEEFEGSIDDEVEVSDETEVRNTEETIQEETSGEEVQEVESDLVAFANNGVLPEETHHEEVTEENSLEEVANDEIKGTLDEAMDEVNSDANVDDEMDVDMFKDSMLKADTIVKEEDYEDNFDDLEVGAVSNDNIMSDVANSMNSLINLNKKQKEVITKYKDQIDKLNFAARSMELKITKSQAKNKVLQEQIHRLEQQVARQNKEIEEMRPQLAGKDELVKLLADAQVLLGQDEYSDNDTYYRKVA